MLTRSGPSGWEESRLTAEHVIPWPVTITDTPAFAILGSGETIITVTFRKRIRRGTERIDEEEGVTGALVERASGRDEAEIRCDVEGQSNVERVKSASSFLSLRIPFLFSSQH